MCARTTLPTILTARAVADRLITAKDHASVQISIADVDAEGKILPTSSSFALCGQVRALGESDDSLNRLATKAGCGISHGSCAKSWILIVNPIVLRNVWSYQK